MKHTPIFLALLGVSTFAFATDNDSAAKLSTVIVTSNGVAENEFTAPFAAEIHNHIDLEKSGAINLYEYLKRFSSVTVMPSYGNPYTQLLDIRGFGTENGHQNIVITVNGRRLNNIDMAPQLLSSIPVESIERIEIIKGSGAVIQGDGAMAGSINIITRDQTGGSVNLSAGSHGHSSASASLGLTQDFFALQILAENARTDGLRDKDINGLDDASDTNNLSASLKIFPTKESELRFTKERSWLDTTYGGTLSKDQLNDDPKQNGGKAYTEQEFSTDITRLGGSYQFGNTAKVNIDHFIEKKDSLYVAFPPASKYDYRSTTLSSELNAERLTLALGAQLFDGERDGGSNTTEKNNLGAYVQASYRFTNTVISAGFRHEEVEYKYQNASDNLKDKHKLNSWELGMNHQLSQELSLFANFTSGFQAPDIDRFFVQDYSNYPAVTTAFNGFIDPAKNKTFNLGVNHFIANNQLKATVFYSKLTNEIYYDPLTFSNTNIDKSNKFGIELQDKYQLLENLAFRVNYTWIKAEIDEEDSGNGAFDGKEMPGVSEHSLIAGVEYQPIENGTLSMNQTWHSKAYALNDFQNNFSQKQKAFNTTDLGYAHQFDKFTLYAQVNNLFDMKNGLWVQDDSIYPINFSRTWYAGIRASF